MAIICPIQVLFLTLLFGVESGFLRVLWPLSLLFIVTPATSLIFSFIYAIFCITAFIALSSFDLNALREWFNISHHIEFSYAQPFVVLFCGWLLVNLVLQMKQRFQTQRDLITKLANTDALTGLVNRRFFTHHINSLLHRKGITHYCIALGDVDNFKRINDTYGHDVGDQVLRDIADCFIKYTKLSDIVCRWGGEEFIVYLPNCTLAEGYLILEALREVTNQLKINEQSISMSFGLVEANPNDNFAQTLRSADRLLYSAKREGRNNVQL